ncbi:MAG: hypothetical protein AB8B73_09195 [Ekhidna sp.]
MIIIENTVLAPKRDTILIIPSSQEYEILNANYLQSKKLYDSIHSLAQKSKITKEIYNLLITSRPQKTKEITAKEPRKSEEYFKEFQDRTISKINYVSVEIFTGSVNDTTLSSNSSIVQFCNKMHNDTRNAVIQKHLLFSLNSKVDPYDMADTERIIRSLSYIEDAKITLSADQNNSNNIVATIITKDRFPWSGDLDVDSSEGANIKFTNKNILGTGNEFGIGYWRSFNNSPVNGFDAKYSIRNIKNSFIDGSIFVSDNFLGKSKGVTLNRAFISPKIKYFGAATFEHVQPLQDLIFADSIYEVSPNIDRKSYDIWAARSYQLDKRKNITLALRLNRDYFSDRPSVKADSNIYFHNHHLLLGGISYSKINFLKTKKIQNFNLTEDVPVGFVYTFLFGRDWTEFGTRSYRGLQASYSMYSEKVGYGLFNLESGYFLLPNQKINQIIKIKINHFTPIITIGKSEARVFTKLNFFDGERLSAPISQSISSENRIRNINGNQLRGNKLFSLSSELVIFQPWYYYGFRFATLINAGIGHIREDRVAQPYHQTYLSVGTGIRIQNESLVINTFELRISIFPNPPPAGDVFNLKITLSTPSFFQKLTIGKPRIVGID